MTMTDLVWADTLLDCNARYECKVTRVGDDGQLTITLLGGVDYLLHRERVNVDRADADKWRTHCETVVHDPDLRSIAP